MIEKTNILAAAGNFTNTGGGALTVNFQNGCAVARTGAGTFTITLDIALANSSVVPLFTPQSALNVALVVSSVVQSLITTTINGQSVQQTVFTVTTAATLGAAAGADIAGTVGFAIFAVGAPGLSGV
jgi:hypothetical protein